MEEIMRAAAIAEIQKESSSSTSEYDNGSSSSGDNVIISRPNTKFILRKNPPNDNQDKPGSSSLNGKQKVTKKTFKPRT